MDSSGRLVSPTTTAPAARSRATTGWSWPRAPPDVAALPSRIGSPATGTQSLIATGTPPSGRSARSARASTSAASLAASAALTRTNAPSSGLSRAIRSRCPVTTSAAVTSPDLTAAAICPAGRPTHPAMLTSWPRRAPKTRNSEHAEPVIGGPQRAAGRKRVPQPVLLRRLGQRPADGLVGEFGRDHDRPVRVGHHQVARAHRQAAHHGGLPPRGNRGPPLAVKRQHPTTPHRVAQRGDEARVTAVPVDQGAVGPAGPRGGGEQLAPAGGPGRAARGDQDDLSRPDVIQRGDLAGVRLGGDLVHLGDQERVGLPGDHLAGPERADGGVKHVVAVPEVIQDVRDHRGVQAARRRIPRPAAGCRVHPASPDRTRIFTCFSGSSLSRVRPPVTAAASGIRSVISGAAVTAPRPSSRSAIRKSSSQTCDSEPISVFSPRTRSIGTMGTASVMM